MILYPLEIVKESDKNTAPEHCKNHYIFSNKRDDAKTSTCVKRDKGSAPKLTKEVETSMISDQLQGFVCQKPWGWHDLMNATSICFFLSHVNWELHHIMASAQLAHELDLGGRPRTGPFP